MINVEFSTLPVPCPSGGYLAKSTKTMPLFCQAGLPKALCTQNRQREAGGCLDQVNQRPRSPVRDIVSGISAYVSYRSSGEWLPWASVSQDSVEDVPSGVNDILFRRGLAAALIHDWSIDHWMISETNFSIFTGFSGFH